MTRKLRRIFRHFVSAGGLCSLGLGLVASACGSVPSGKPDVDELANDLCERHGAICVPASLKKDLGLVEDGDINWGVFSYREADLPGATVRYGYVCYDDEKCAEDLELCGFVILHEIGHLREGSDQTDADCWAAQHSTPEQYAAGLEFICGHHWRTRCDALKECAP